MNYYANSIIAFIVKMHFPVEDTGKTLLFFTILITWIIGFGEMTGDKTLSLRIGFDLTKGTNGAPALRIRDFEDSDASEHERHLRAESDGKEDEKVVPAIRADSFSDEEAKARGDGSSKEGDAQSSDNSGDESGKDRHRSTKGLQPEEYEPEENSKIHGRHQDDEDDDSGSDARRHRIKRDIDYEALKRKSKKFRSARKQGVTRA